jgi:hypothetical protein
MSKPHIHAQSSVKRYGGVVSDYEPLHTMMDSSKASLGDNRHRAIFHHSFGTFVMEKLFSVDFDTIEKLRKKYNLPKEFEDEMIQFLNNSRTHGTCIKNSDGKMVSTRDLAENHISEDFRGRYIPTAQDYLAEIEMKDWMNNGNGEPPPSFKKLDKPTITKTRQVTYD